MMSSQYDKTIDSETSVTMDKEQIPEKVGHLSVFATIFLLVSPIIGVGTLLLPNFLAKSGYVGIIVMIAACLIAIYNGSILGKCWIIVLQRYPEYNGQCRNPYVVIGERAIGGTNIRYIMYFAVGVTCFSTCVLFLMLIAQNLYAITAHVELEINFHVLMSIVVCGLVPLSWFGSPKDLTWMAVLAILSATCGLILVFSQLTTQNPSEHIHEDVSSNFKMFILSLGAFFVPYAGTCTFPTIQHDMKEPQKFTLAVVIAYICCFLVFATISIAGYYAFGETVSINILLTLPDGPIKVAALTVYILHLMFAYIIFVNPAVQNIEEGLDIPRSKYNIQKVLLRSFLVVFVTYWTAKMPHVSSILDQIDGPCIAFVTLIAPPTFHIYLTSDQDDGCKNQTIKLSGFTKAVNYFIIFIGIIVACVEPHIRHLYS